MHRYFPSQQDNEEVYLVIRSHWFVLFSKLSLLLVLFAVFIGVRYAISRFTPELLTGTAGPLLQAIGYVYVLWCVSMLILTLTFYYLNVQIVSNIRIVDIDQTSLFHRTISELNIDKIEDTTSDSKGIFATMFNYGNVYVQTAGTTQRFQFETIPYPDEVKKLILTLYEQKNPGDTQNQ